MRVDVKQNLNRLYKDVQCMVKDDGGLNKRKWYQVFSNTCKYKEVLKYMGERAEYKINRQLYGMKKGSKTVHNYVWSCSEDR